MGVMILVIALVVFGFAHLIADPLKKMITVIEKIADGHFGAEASC